jgi:3-oxoadipate enol-lactonase
MTVLHHEVHGDGPPVLFLHAGIADLRMWSGVAERLAPSHRVILCDLQGWGRTPLRPGRVSNTDDLVALLDALAVPRTAVVGASYGGLVALSLAVLHPERVTALGLLDATLDEFDRSEELEAFGAAEDAAVEARDVDRVVALNVETWVDRPGRRPEPADPAVRALVADMQRRAYEAQIDVYDEVEFDDPDPPIARRLGEIAVPALVVVGEHDLPDYETIARRLVAELPGAERVETVAGAAHLPALERPAEVADLLTAFLAGAGR